MQKKKNNINVHKKNGGINRRDFLKLSCAAVGAATLAATLGPVKLSAAEQPPTVAASGVKSNGDILLRMQEDVRRALSKPADKRKWSMVIDIGKCVGCHACAIACKSENVLPPGVIYRRVLDLIEGKYPDLKREYVPVLCNHCQNAPCVDACPVSATKIREDGIVDMNYKRCIGCRACLNACPYGARSSDFGKFYTEDTPKLQDYELRPNFEYRKKWARKKGKSPIGNARKCHFCIHRIEEGLLPACVITCIGKATFFGDAADDNSLIAELIKTKNTIKLKENLRTKPRVYYIGLEGVKL